MHFWQKIKQKIFFFFNGFIGRDEPSVINQADAGASVLHLVHILREYNVGQVLIICAAKFKKQEYFSKIKESLHAAGIKFTLYSQNIENPSVTLVEQSVHLYFSNNCQAILAIGGGSILDLAKATKARILRPGKSLHKLHGVGKIKSGNKTPPLLITCPTTFSSSGSSRTAWIVDHTNQTKYILLDKAIQPNYVLHCAEYISVLPDQLIATTILGTLVQAIEALLSTNNSQYINQNSTEAIVQILASLEKKNLLTNKKHASIHEVSSDHNFADQEKINDKILSDFDSTNLLEKNKIVSTLQNASDKAGNASGRAVAGYATAIANAFAVYFDLAYSETSAPALCLVLEAYLSIKPDLFADLTNKPLEKSSDKPSDEGVSPKISEKKSHRLSDGQLDCFSGEQIISQIQSLQKIWDLPIKFPQIKVEYIPEIVEYVKKEVHNIHSPPLMIPDEKLTEIINNLI